MIHPQASYTLALDRQRALRREAAGERLINAARQPGQRMNARVLLPLADALLFLGMRLRQRCQPGESLAIVPVARLSERGRRDAYSIHTRPALARPVFAFQVIQCLPQRTMAFTYWSLIPPARNKTAGMSGLGLVCLAHPME